MKQALCGIAVLLITGAALAQASVEGQAAQAVKQGHVAPAAVIEQLKQVPIIRIGSQQVRPLPPAPSLRIGKRGSNMAQSTTENAVAASAAGSKGTSKTTSKATNDTPSETTNQTTSETPSGQTLVARASDNLVGISSNELVVVSSSLDAIAAKVASLRLAGVQTHAYPKLKLLVVKTAQFDQVETVHDAIAAAFPDAKFDLPVTYFPLRPN